MNNQEQFLKILKEIGRVGIKSFVHWIDFDTDFFTAPASTKYHGSYEGGLLQHSLDVYDSLYEVLKMKQFSKMNINKESIIICALLHDICKTNFYKIYEKNVKNEITGKWEKENYYKIEDSEPYGHGEKSVMLIEKHMRLTDEERYAIRWHMGGFDESVKGGSYSINKTFEKYPFALALHIADMSATYMY